MFEMYLEFCHINVVFVQNVLQEISMTCTCFDTPIIIYITQDIATLLHTCSSVHVCNVQEMYVRFCLIDAKCVAGNQYDLHMFDYALSSTGGQVEFLVIGKDMSSVPQQ